MTIFQCQTCFVFYNGDKNATCPDCQKIDEVLRNIKLNIVSWNDGVSDEDAEAFAKLINEAADKENPKESP